MSFTTRDISSSRTSIIINYLKENEELHTAGGEIRPLSIILHKNAHVILSTMVTMYVCMSLFVPVCTHSSLCVAYGWRCLRRPEEGIESSEAEITGSCERSAWVVGTTPESSAAAAHSQPLSHLSFAHLSVLGTALVL